MIFSASCSSMMPCLPSMAAWAIVGTMINLKPVLHVDDEGHLVMLSKVRGRKKSLIGLVDCMEKQLGDWKDKNDVINNWNIDRKFHPEMKEDEREEKLAGWEKAVKYSFGWAKN
jgi:fatty acid-binding protein DegV